MEQELVQIFDGAPFSFDALAQRIFRRQYERCAPYRRFCDRRGISPDDVTNWRQIPHLPVSAFKHARIYSGEGEPAHLFRTSGTTEGAELRGSHWFERLDLYAACARASFKRFMLPDHDRMPMLMLARHPRESTDSSLSWYLQQQEEAFGAPGGGWFVTAEGLRIAELKSALLAAAGPVALLGTAFAFVHLVESGLTCKLAPGSRVMETGGFKGRSREVPKDELYRLIRHALGPDVVCINQYGMTECSSNCYDQRLLTGSSHKMGPPWMQVRILDPERLVELPQGEAGIIAVTDLANLYSCAFLLTQDIGVQYADGFEVLGRAPGSVARGCSIALDQFLAVQQR